MLRRLALRGALTWRGHGTVFEGDRAARRGHFGGPGEGGRGLPGRRPVVSNPLSAVPRRISTGSVRLQMRDAFVTQAQQSSALRLRQDGRFPDRTVAAPGHLDASLGHGPAARAGPRLAGGRGAEGWRALATRSFGRIDSRSGQNDGTRPSTACRLLTRPPDRGSPTTTSLKSRG
jgi:hypothetical protein